MDVPAQAQKTNSLSLCLFVLLRPLVDWMMPTHIENISIQTTNLNTNLTLIDTPRKMLYLLSGHPVTQSSFGIKLSITPLIVLEGMVQDLMSFNQRKYMETQVAGALSPPHLGWSQTNFYWIMIRETSYYLKSQWYGHQKGKGGLRWIGRLGLTLHTQQTKATKKTKKRQMTDENLLNGSGNSAECSVMT